MLNIFNVFKNKEKKSLIEWTTVKDILEPYKRLAWYPKVEEKKSDVKASKFSGVPMLLKNENWPCCDNCKQPMQLFLQLNSEGLPKLSHKPFGEGVLQVFYCTNWDKECEVKCEAYFPFSKSTLVRILTSDDVKSVDLAKSMEKDYFPEKEIVSWEYRDDYPSYEELEELGYTLSEEQSALLYELEYPLPKDKLLGCPYWVQGVEYPNCPECGSRMKLIFQIDSEDNIPYMFGDVGCSHITQCEKHKDVLAIAWACS